MVVRPSKKTYISRPRPLLFLEAASLFLLFVITNVCTNENQQARGPRYPFCSVWYERGYKLKKKTREELSGRLNHSPIDVFNTPFLLQYIV